MKTLRYLLSLIFHPFRHVRAAVEVESHGTTGAQLREAVRNLEADEIHESRVAFGRKFLTYSNRARQAWLQANGIPVVKHPGRTMRQDQQVAALAWFDKLHGKEVVR